MIIWPTSPQPHFLPELTFTCTQSQSGITGGHFHSKELSDQERVSLRKSGLGWPESIWTKRHSQDKHLQIEDIMSTKVTWSPPLSQFSLPLSSPLTVRLGPSAICTPWMYTTPSNYCSYPCICLWIKQIHQWHPSSYRNFPYKANVPWIWSFVTTNKNVWEPAECSWHMSTSRNPFWPSHLLVLTLNLLSLLLPQLLLLPQFNCCCSFSTSTIWPQVTCIHTPSH